MIRPAPLSRRLFSISYEGLLLAAVTILSGLPAAILKTIAEHKIHALIPLVTPMAAVIVIASWWLYFRLNWCKSGQTLPMRVWKISLTDAMGTQPSLRQYRLRFIWATIFLALIPAAAYISFKNMGFPPKSAFYSALLWWILPWGFAFFDPYRRFLYDYLARTHLQDLRPLPPKKQPNNPT